MIGVEEHMAEVDHHERIERARSGDERAWAEIVERLGPRILGYARGKGIADADDVVQDVFLAAARRIGDFEGTWSNFRSWIFSIAYRQIVDRYRRSGREDASLPRVLVDDLDPGPADEVVDREAASDAVRALDVLSGDERDVVLLRVVAGLETAEVAEAVGKRPGTVRVVQSRALDKVRAELRRRGYGELR
ncbi:MAG: RNA polymerase sigma factor [Acidimicrobiia bacterium]|nr:RNA polymerase sigma factor [Acidimicrobiia bacterium]